jgi:sortase A
VHSEPGPQPARRRRPRLGTVLIVLGFAVAAYGATVALWRDPVTDLYARWRQHQLAGELERTFARAEAEFAPARSVLDIPDPSERLERERLVVADSANRLQTRLERGKPLGRLTIPKLGLNTVFVHGTRWGPDLSQGPGHYPQTSLPGVGRTMAIAGHRTTFGAPFRHIDDLRRGHMIELRLPYATFVYRVSGHEIVRNNDWSVIRDRGYDTLVLSACHPLYSAQQRWIVYARLVEVRPVRGEPYALTRSGQAVPAPA